MVAGFDAPKDGPDAEESGIPALYTYFGQFIDHDITFDPVSSLTKRTGSRGRWSISAPRRSTWTMSTAVGPDDQPYMYDGRIKFRSRRAL